MKSKETYIATLITSILGVGCIYYFMAVVYKDDNYRMLSGAIVMAVEMIVLLLAGIILTTTGKTKTIGQGVLLGSAITLVIGFGICSLV